MGKRAALGMRAKILFLCVSCTLLALALQTLFFQYSASSIIYRQEREASRKSIENMQGELHAWIKSYENNLIKIYNQNEFTRDLSLPLPLKTLQEKHGKVAYTMALSVFDPSQNVNALYIYDMDNRLISFYRGFSTPRHNYPVDIHQSPSENNVGAVLRYVQSDDKVMLVSSYYNRSREKDTVRFVLKIYTNNVSKKIGYIVCDVDSNSFARIVEKFVHVDRQIVWLQPQGDRAAVHFGQIEGKTAEFYDSITAKIRDTGLSDVDRQSVRDNVFFDVPQEKYNLTAYSLTPQYLLEENQRDLGRSMIVIALLVIFVAVISASIVTASLTNPLRGMDKTLKKIRNGETDLRLTELRSDEIGTLGSTINQMLDRIQDLISQQYNAKLLLKQTEYKALQAQMNPHFLYNSLETMGSIAASQQCHTVGDLCQALSKVFRYSIDMTNPLSTIGDEILHLKNYMYVMNVRTQNSIELEIDIDRSLLVEEVPRLSIQPLVENALNHGLKNKRGAKKIRIEAAVRGDDIVLSVSDNGVGMDADEINRQLHSHPEDILEKASSIGLGNINARIGLLFGNAYGVRVQSAPGQGSEVTLTIPRVYGDPPAQREVLLS